VVEAQSEFIIRFLPDGKLVFANEAYSEYFNVERDKLSNTNIFDFVPPEHREEFVRHLRMLTPEHPIRVADSHFVSRDWMLFQRWQNRAIFNENGEVVEYLAVGRDITDQKMQKRLSGLPTTISAS